MKKRDYREKLSKKKLHKVRFYSNLPSRNHRPLDRSEPVRDIQFCFDPGLVLGLKSGPAGFGPWIVAYHMTYFNSAKKEEELKKTETPKLPNKSELQKTESTVKIEEVSTIEISNEVETPVDQKSETTVNVESIKETEEVKKNFIKPTTSFELERDWRSFSNKSTKAAYLKFIDDPISIARYFAPQLPKYIIDICRNIIKIIQVKVDLQTKDFHLKFTRKRDFSRRV